MSLLSRLFGGGEEAEDRRRRVGQNEYDQQPTLTDEQALERYRYMLRTAPPEALEQAHEEAFAKLTPEQRQLALQQLAATMPEHERAAGTQDDPKTLARLATRAELRQPGSIERAFGADPRMGGMGGMGMFGGSLLSSLAAGFVGSMIANQLFESFDNDAAFAESDAGQQADTQEPLDSQAADLGGDFGGDDIGGDFDMGI